MIRRVVSQAKDLRNFLNGHELTRRSLAASYYRLIRWQIVSRLISGPLDVSFVDNTRLLVSRGMIGATGNVYAGLHEFAEMAFVLHLLRSGDLFADVGANVGSYTVLASGVRQARTVAFEPIAEARQAMQRNIERNNIPALAEVRPIALAATAGKATMTNRDDTMNRIVANALPGHSVETVPLSTLDIEFAHETPILIKIDAEGSDGDVVFGGRDLLRRDGLKALIAEFSGLGSNEADAHRLLLEAGFQACTYEPFTRTLTDLAGYAFRTIYVRDRAFIEQRLAAASPFRVLSFTI